MWNDFKAFAFKGNIFDLAIAVVIGAAFGKIVSSFVENILTPLLGILMTGIDVSGLKIQVGDAEILYGVFIQSIIDFLIIAGAIFLAIRLLMKFKRKEEENVEKEAPPVDVKEQLLEEIRDLLKEQKTN
ncbi:large conductance mechanosensitive channel protein MscL [Chungangia koreensis]|uniref:Large-conductance mechanosensitive channel n=1 Tax=Chungangia koreensis TaxID=752657 RepID=A0ABV8X8A8_9LACT